MNDLSPGAAAFVRRTSPELLRAIRAGWKGTTTPEQSEILSRWVERKVMGERWQGADDVLRQSRDEENDAMDERDQLAADRCWCGRVPARHRGRHKGSKGKSANLTGPEALEDVPRIVIDEKPSLEIVGVEEVPGSNEEPGLVVTRPDDAWTPPPPAQLTDLQLRYIDMLLDMVEKGTADMHILDRIERLLDFPDQG